MVFRTEFDGHLSEFYEIFHINIFKPNPQTRFFESSCFKKWYLQFWVLRHKTSLGWYTLLRDFYYFDFDWIPFGPVKIRPSANLSGGPGPDNLRVHADGHDVLRHVLPLRGRRRGSPRDHDGRSVLHTLRGMQELPKDWPWMSE